MTSSYTRTWRAGCNSNSALPGEYAEAGAEASGGSFREDLLRLYEALEAVPLPSLLPRVVVVEEDGVDRAVELINSNGTPSRTTNIARIIWATLRSAPAEHPRITPTHFSVRRWQLKLSGELGSGEEGEKLVE